MCAERFVQHDVNVEPAGHRTIDALEEREDVVGRVAIATLGDHFSGGDVQRGEQVGGPVAFVVGVIVPARPGRIGSDGCVRSNAWHCVFSSN
jgi:hypothetical protein